MAERRLGICIDECLGIKIAPVLREIRAPGAPLIQHVRELGLHGVKDEVLFGELRKLDFTAMVTKDSAILAAAIRRKAWAASGLTLFVMHHDCGNLPLFEQVRCLIWWWPAIWREASESDTPAAWRVRRQLQGTLERHF